MLMLFPYRILNLFCDLERGILNLSDYSDTENLLDAQVPYLPSVEVLVKALIVIASEALATACSASLQIVMCSHHPCIVGTGKRDAVWRVCIYFII